MFSTMPRIGHAHLLEHIDGFARVFERHIGGRCHDDGAGEWSGLDQR